MCLNHVRDFFFVVAALVVGFEPLWVMVLLVLLVVGLRLVSGSLMKGVSSSSCSGRGFALLAADSEALDFDAPG